MVRSSAVWFTSKVVGVRGLLVGFVVLAFAAGCGDDDSDGAESAVAATEDGDSLADVTRIDERVDVRLGGDVDFAEVAGETQPVELGDAVRTDGSGSPRSGTSMVP